MLEDAAKRQGYTLSELTKNEWLDKLLRRYTLNNVDDLYAAVGFGGLATNQVLSRLCEEYRKNAKPEELPQAQHAVEAKPQEKIEPQEKEESERRLRRHRQGRGQHARAPVQVL